MLDASLEPGTNRATGLWLRRALAHGRVGCLDPAFLTSRHLQAQTARQHSSKQIGTYDDGVCANEAVGPAKPKASAAERRQLVHAAREAAGVLHVVKTALKQR